MGFLYHGSVYVGFASESDQTADIARGRLWANQRHRPLGSAMLGASDPGPVLSG